jgi:hypothetical protein
MNPTLILHSPTNACVLNEQYRRAFATATELMILSAYLTEWDSTLKLNPGCTRFRMVIGKDFGITRKLACEAVLHWLPANKKADFLVADEISGFHPKALFWKNKAGQAFTVVGSSNLTAAAFGKNFEANIISALTESEYAIARRWVSLVETYCVPVSEDWLSGYIEAVVPPRTGSRSNKKVGKLNGDIVTIIGLALPTPVGMKTAITIRKKTLAAYARNQRGLFDLFRHAAQSKSNASRFYEELSDHWGGDVGGRIQGSGWAIKGKHSNFHLLANSFVAIIDASPDDRDDVVIREIDRLSKFEIPTRQAFLSEMLCLAFPELYPILNKPVLQYLKSIKFRAASGASEGAKYIDLARKLRRSLITSPKYPAKNLVELDAVIELADKLANKKVV